MGILGRLAGALFGPKEPEEGVPPEQGAQYGNLAEREKMAQQLRARNVEEWREEEGEGEKPRLWGYGRPSHMLSERVRREQLPRGYKVTRKLDKLERQLEGAESETELRKIAKRAVSERGLFRKIERGMEKRLEDASSGERRRYERELRQLERRLRNPSRYVR